MISYLESVVGEIVHKELKWVSMLTIAHRQERKFYLGIDVNPKSVGEVKNHFVFRVIICGCGDVAVDTTDRFKLSFILVMY